MIDQADVQEFLSQKRLAVVGASDDDGNFGTTIYRELRGRGYDVVAVNPGVSSVADDVCYPDLRAVPGDIDGVVVMVRRDIAVEVVRDCVARGVTRVWLFKGLGGAGAVSKEAVQVCREHDIAVIEGACPLMFLEPVGWAHRVHRGIRRWNGSLAKAS